MARLLLATLLLVCMPALRAAAESAGAIEGVKAAFLYKFAAYVDWPEGAFPQADSPLVIGVAGADDIAGELERAVAGRNVAGRPIHVRRVTHADNAGKCCQILFIGAQNERAHVRDLLATAQGHPVLTVTDEDAEHPKGSIINFLAVTNKVRFDISREAAERNRLQLRSQLLAVARQVSPP